MISDWTTWKTYRLAGGVRRILASELPGLEVWAFGSRARHTAKPYSDLDLAIIAPQPLSLAQLANLTCALDASDPTIRLDVVVQNGHHSFLP